MQKQTRFFQIAALSAICWTVVMRLFSPENIVQFEMAKSTLVATTIIKGWGADGIAMAKTSLYLDFIYILFYGAAIALGCRVATNYSKNKTFIKAGIAFSTLTLIAGGCDVIENIAMLKSLKEINQANISVAYYFATAKFTLLFLALLFILIAFATDALRKFSK
jgi:hypothetical protein